MRRTEEAAAEPHTAERKAGGRHRLHSTISGSLTRTDLCKATSSAACHFPFTFLYVALGQRKLRGPRTKFLSISLKLQSPYKT